MTAPSPIVARHDDLIVTGGAEGPLSAQIDGIAAALTQAGGGIGDLASLRVFYRAGTVDPAGLADALADALHGRAVPTLTLVPVARAGWTSGDLTIEAMAVTGPTLGVVAGPDARFAVGLRRGRFLFLGAQGAGVLSDLTGESRDVMQRLGQTLTTLGAGFADVVRMNRWYHAAGTKDAWEPSARAVADFYTEPGPVATAISLAAPLPGGRAIQIDLMGMLALDGTSLPKRHSWPDGHWDWPIHLPYKHGLACGGIGFVGGQVSIDTQAQVIDSAHLDRQVRRSLANIDRVAAGLGAAAGPPLRFEVHYALPGPAGDPLGIAALQALADQRRPVMMAGFANLSYPGMRVEIEAMVPLSDRG